jgi:K+-transporting ATPase ATPase B chain
VVFANFAEAMAEGRGKAQADTLRKSRTKSIGRKLMPDGSIIERRRRIAPQGRLFVVEANELIAADGEIIEGAASVNESAITGESAPVIREAGGDRSAVTGGTTVLSDRSRSASPPTPAKASWTG